MKRSLITKILLLAFAAHGWAVAAVPQSVLATLNINADDAKGDGWRSLVLIDATSNKLWQFPLRSIAGGALEGQPMHATLAPDKKQVYVTMGGSKTLALRVVTLSVDWSGAAPKVAVVRTTEVLPANTRPPHGPGMPNMGMTDMDHAMQEGHGPHLSPDGRRMYFSELNNNRLRVLDTKAGKFIGEPASHPSLKTPHGVYPNPGMTRAMSTQYQLGGNEVSLWKIDPVSGALKFDRAVTMAEGQVRCAHTHTAAWLDDHRFYTGCTQEADQGDKGTSQRSVWLVDAKAGKAQLVLDAGRLLEGVSDVALTGKKLYVAEGNVVKEGVPPGHVSVWDVAQPGKPTFIKRLSAGKGLPEAFADAHELATSPDGRYVFVQSYRSGHLVKIDSRVDQTAGHWTAAQGLPMPHGMSVR